MKSFVPVPSRDEGGLGKDGGGADGEVNGLDIYRAPEAKSAERQCLNKILKISDLLSYTSRDINLFSAHIKLFPWRRIPGSSFIPFSQMMDPQRTAECFRSIWCYFDIN